VDTPPANGPVAVLTNPSAGSRRERQLVPEVLRRLTAVADLDVLHAHTGAEAEQRCREAVEGGAAALIAVGGDGTLHAALQAVAGTKVPFAVVPAGSGNDFALALGAPPHPVTAAERVAGALRAGSTRGVDLARVTGADGTQRWYGAVLAAGFDAIVNERANRMRWPRGERRYDIAIFTELVKLRARRYQIMLDDTERSVEAVLVAVGNTAHYGGGIRMCPEADPTDGLLDVVIAHRMSRLTLIRLRPRAYKGTHVTHRLVETHRVRSLELATDGVVAYADGERCLPLPVTITCVPGALRVLGD
jgi:diacylglycerol kinase (ATP)